LSLPLDFEDSGIPLPTERRKSCYYESTLIIRNFSANNSRQNSQLALIDLLLNDKSPMDTVHKYNEENKDASPQPDNLFDNFSFVNPPQDELELKEQFDNFIEQMRLNELKL